MHSMLPNWREARASLRGCPTLILHARRPSRVSEPSLRCTQCQPCPGPLATGSKWARFPNRFRRQCAGEVETNYTLRLEPGSGGNGDGVALNLGKQRPKDHAVKRQHQTPVKLPGPPAR